MRTELRKDYVRTTRDSQDRLRTWSNAAEEHKASEEDDVKELVARLEHENEWAKFKEELDELEKLTGQEQYKTLEQRLGGLPEGFVRFRDACKGKLDKLWERRPNVLRITPMLPTGRWKWEPDTDCTEITGSGKYLPNIITDTKRQCDMALLPVAEGSQDYVYLDVGEVSWKQYELVLPENESPVGPSSRRPDGDELDWPVHKIKKAEVETFLRAGAPPAAGQDELRRPTLALPTLAEYHRAIGVAPGSAYLWGNEPEPGWKINIRGDEGKAAGTFDKNHHDDHVGLAPTTHRDYQRGDFFHLIGNVREIVTDGDAWVLVGGGYGTHAPRQELKYGKRSKKLRNEPGDNDGFRCALTIPIE